MADISIISLFARLLVAMAVVLGIMVLAGRVLRGRGMTRGRRGRVVPIEVLARQGVGRSASVTMVRTSGKVLVLGVTEASINVLAEIDPGQLEMEEDGPEADRTRLLGGGPTGQPGGSWRALLDAARERTVRRS